VDHCSKQQVKPLKLVNHARIQHDRVLANSEPVAQALTVAQRQAFDVDSEVQHGLRPAGEAARQ
jgi:hypothetical protein